MGDFLAVFRALLLSFSLATVAWPQAPNLTQVVYPTVPGDILYGLHTSSPVRSDDGGRTWQPMYVFTPGTAQNIRGIAMASGRTDTVFAAATLDRGGIWKSSDSGRTWTVANRGLPQGNDPVLDLTAAADDANRLWARAGDGLYRSTDGAGTWTRMGTLPAGTSAIGIGNRAPYRMMVMTLGGAMFLSDDSGASWQERTRIGAAPTRTARSVVVDPARSGSFFVISFVDRVTQCELPGGAVHRTRDAGATWTPVWTSGSCNLTASRVLLDPTRPILLVVSSNPPSSCRSTDLGDSSDCRGNTFGDYSYVGIDPRNPDRVMNNDGRLSTDAGVTTPAPAARLRPSLPVLDPIRFELNAGLTGTQPVRITAPEGVGFRAAYRASVEGAPWLTVATASPVLGAELTLRFSAAGLAPGSYTGTLILESDETGNARTTATVELTVLSAASSGVRYSIATVAGRGSAAISEGASAGNVNLPSPRFLCRDGAGSIYFYDSTGNRIWKIDGAGRISSVLGSGQRADSPDGPVSGFRLNFVQGLAVSRSGQIYFGETSGIRTVENGQVRTLVARTAQIGASQFSTLGTPSGFTVDRDDNLWVSATPGIVRLRPGRGPELVVPRLAYTSFSITRLHVAESGAIFFADSLNDRVLRIDGVAVRVVAGTGSDGYNGDGRTASGAQLDSPQDVAVDADGNVLIADNGNRRVRMVTPEGLIFTIAGDGRFGSTGDGSSATAVSISPSSFALESDGGVLVAGLSEIVRLRRSRVPAPAVSSGSMRNAGGFGPTLAPGALFSLFGTNLGASQALASGAPWPETLGGAKVLINGRAAPLFFASETQINGQVPYEIAAGSATVQAETAGGRSTSIDFVVRAAAPGILEFGQGRAAAVNANGSVNTDESPAAPGSAVVVYLTGIGGVDNPVPTGAAASGDPLSRPVAEANATIGGENAEVLFLGLAPGFIGLAQANLIVPDIADGTYPLVISVGGEASNGPQITVRR